MPSKSKTNPRRYRKRSNYKRPFSRKQVKAIRKIAEKSGELKSKQYNNTDNDLQSTFNMNTGALSIAQGTDDDERIGDSIYLHKVQARFQVNTLVSSTLRLFAFQCLEEVAPSGVSTLKPNEFWPNIQVSGARYKVLYDRVINIDPDSKGSMLLKVDIPGKKLKIKKIPFDEGAATMKNGQVLIYLTSTNTTASQITVDANLKAYWYDN